MYVPVDRYVVVGSVNACYWSEGEGTPVVLLHGLGGSAAGWLPSFEALATQHRVYAPDLLGHGYTAGPEDASYNHTELVEFVLHFMTALKIDCAHIIGHSLGGLIALRLAMENQTLVNKMVLLDSA